MSTSLEYRHVTKSFAEGGAPAVCAVSARVEKGEVLALVGESGSGKTTLLRLAAGLEAPDEGEVLLGDKTVAGPAVWLPPERRGVGLVFQDGALFPHLSVAENVAYGLKGREAEARQSTVDFMLAMVGLSGMGKRFPHELSGGERQRLAVARALAPQPKVILLDEPFSNLDPALRRSLREEIRSILKKLKATAILVTHDTDDALCVGDRVAVLRKGSIIQIGTPQEIYRHPKNGYCARLFGPANGLRLNGCGTRWVRPEEMRLLDRERNGAIAVRVDRVHDAGRHCEVVVRPVDPEKAAHAEDWIVYASSAEEAQAGDEKWLQIDESPDGGPAA